MTDKTATKGKVARSVTKAQLLSPTSFWVSPKAEFDQAKREALLAILRLVRPKPARVAEQYLIQETQLAVIDLEAAREAYQETGADELKLLHQLTQAAAGFAQAWSGVTSDDRLRGIFDDHLGGVRRAEASEDLSQGESAGDRQKRKIAEMLARRERVARIGNVATDDIWWMIGDLRPLFLVLSSVEGARNEAEYRCANRIARAWSENIGRAPTLSRNEGSATPFQRFIAAAVPRPPIGSGVLRNVIEAAVWGASQAKGGRK